MFALNIPWCFSKLYHQYCAVYWGTLSWTMCKGDNFFTRIYILSNYEKDRFKKKICLVFSYPYSYILWKECRTVLCFYVAKRCSGYRHIKLQQFLAWERNIPHTQTHAKKMLIHVWPECVYPGAQCAMMVKWMTEKT